MTNACRQMEAGSLLPSLSTPHKSSALSEHWHPSLLPRSAQEREGQALGTELMVVAVAFAGLGQPWEEGTAQLGYLLRIHDTCSCGRVFQAQLSHTKMSCYDLCPPKSGVAVPQPIAESCNELCARQCPDSSAFIQPPPVVVTFPGPILSSFPQQAVVGSSGAPAFGGNLGLGGLYGAGATLGSGGLCTFGRPYASPACSPCALPRYSRKLWDTCGPC
ncbi:scale keratin-like [Athene cunicularia]|nr:scale keratin-like [Athene cunicularia]